MLAEVVVEGWESGQAVGIYDAHGEVIDDAVAAISRIMGAAQDGLVWEVPLKGQQAYLIERLVLTSGLGIEL